MKKFLNVLYYVFLPITIMYWVLKTLDKIFVIRLTRNLAVRLLRLQEQVLALGIAVCNQRVYDEMFIDLSETIHRQVVLINTLNRLGIVEMDTIKPLLEELNAAISIADKNSIWISKLLELTEISDDNSLLKELVKKSVTDLERFTKTSFTKKLRNNVTIYLDSLK